MKRKGLMICCIICLSVFVVFGIRLVRELRMQKKEAETYVALSQLRKPAVEESKETEEIEPTVEAPSVEAEAFSYEDLEAINEHMVGWIAVPDTRIDYPVMHTPSDPEYYLRRDFYKDYSLSGTPFLDANCTIDGQQWVIYGHHMNNGTMFADLVEFLDRDFRDDHTTIYVDTMDARYTYRVICGFYEQEDGETWTKGYFAYNTEEEFAVYQQHCNEEALFGSLQNVTYHNHLLSLITCSGFDDDIRFVLVAQRVEE